MESLKSEGLNTEQKLKIVHAFKAICLARRQLTDFEAYKRYEDEVVDDLFKDLGIVNQPNRGRNEETNNRIVHPVA